MTTCPTPVEWKDVPDDERKRLARNEAAQRRQTAKRGLPARKVSVEGLWLVQSGCCQCSECAGKVPLNPFAREGAPDRIVIAHPFYRAQRGSPGHVCLNVSLWPHSCNAREAPKETSALAKGKRLGFSEERKAAPKSDRPKNGSRLKGAGFQKAPVSKLSKNHPNYIKGTFR